MAGSHDGRKGSGEWDPEEWPGTEWDQGETSPREDAAGTEGRYKGGSEIRSDIRNVMDDPLYEPRPGDRVLRERGPGRGRPEVRMHARPERRGLSLGQKFLLWIGFAFVSAISFAAGIIVGAGGGIDIPWLPVLVPGTVGRPAAVEMNDLGPPLDADGVIRFGDHGTVPSEAAEEGGVLKSEKPPAPEAPARKVARKVGRKSASPAKAAAPTKRAPAAKPAPKLDPEPEPPADSAAEMTFYETSTGETAMPGLAGAEAVAEDDEAPPDPEPAVKAPAVVEAPVPDADQRKAAAPAPEPEEADEGPPSGAEMLARRLSAGGTRPASVPPALAPASSTAAGDDIFTVQVTTLADEGEARRLAERLKSRGFDARIVPLSRSGLGTLYRIRVGRYSSEEAARSDRDRLASESGAHPYIRME